MVLKPDLVFDPQVRLKGTIQDENLREMLEILSSLAALGVTSQTDKKCAKAEAKARQLQQDYERKRRFLNSCTLQSLHDG